MVRAKFQLISIASHSWNPTAKTLKFQVCYDTTTPENQRFTKATPSGQMEMQVDNPDAVAQFTMGKFYYVDFTEATS